MLAFVNAVPRCVPAALNPKFTAVRNIVSPNIVTSTPTRVLIILCFGNLINIKLKIKKTTVIGARAIKMPVKLESKLSPKFELPTICCAVISVEIGRASCRERVWS
jgi:hypothetical protein